MALLCRLTIPLHSLSIVLRDTAGICIKQPKIELRSRMALLCRLTIPLHSLSIVLRDTLSIIIRHAKVELRFCISLLRRLTIPLHSLSIVLRDTLSIIIRHAKVELRLFLPLLRRFPVPLNRFRLILCDTISEIMTYANVELYVRIVLVRSLSQTEAVVIPSRRSPERRKGGFRVGLLLLGGKPAALFLCHSRRTLEPLVRLVELRRRYDKIAGSESLPGANKRLVRSGKGFPCQLTSPRRFSPIPRFIRPLASILRLRPDDLVGRKPVPVVANGHVLQSRNFVVVLLKRRLARPVRTLQFLGLPAEMRPGMPVLLLILLMGLAGLPLQFVHLLAEPHLLSLLRPYVVLVPRPAVVSASA